VAGRCGKCGSCAYPVTGGLRDIFTDLLGRETERTDLGGERGRSTDLASGGAEVDDLLLWKGSVCVSLTWHLFVPVCIITYLIGVELGRCMAQVSCQQGEEPMLERAILTHG